MRIIPYRASHFENGYVAEFLPTGQRTWRMLRSGGEPIVYPTRSSALQAAEQEYLRRLEPTIRASLPVDPEKAEAKMEAKLQGQADDWLRRDRNSVLGTTTIFRKNGKSFQRTPGKARA